MPTWIGDSNGSWFDAARWSGGVPNAAGAFASFSFASNGGATQVDSGAGAIVGSVSVASTGTHGCDFLGTLIFDSGLAGSSASLTVNTTSAGLPITFQDLNLTSNLDVNVVNANSLARFGGLISGSGRIAKNGNGTLELNGSANTFTGGILLQDGRLDAAGDGALGSGTVTISNAAQFVSTGTIDNTFATIAGATGTLGSAFIAAATGTTMTLTGALNHLSRGNVYFGRTFATGTIIADFSAILENATDSSYTIDPNIELRIGNALVAANLFERPVSAGMTTIYGTLDTNGYATTISTLALFSTGTIHSSVGSLNLTLNHSLALTGPQVGTFQGAAGADQITINAAGPFDLSQATFTAWTAGTDTILINGSSAINALTGSAQRETINGFEGNDTVIGSGGIDTINGGDGNDLIVLNGANGGSFVDGGANSDTLRISGGSIALGSVAGFEAISLLGAATLTLTGNQFATGLASTSVLSGTGTIVINMDAGTQMLTKLMTVQGGSNIDLVVNGTSSSDVIKLGNGADSAITAGAGLDRIQGGNLVDTVNGGDDVDKIAGNGGADILTGGAGADVFKFRAVTDSGTGASADTITDFLAGTDKLNFLRIDADAVTTGDQAMTFIGTATFGVTGLGQIRWIDLGADLRVEVDVNGDGTADMHILLQGAGAQVLAASDFVL
jgi:autotransporter-associated beta strand protein